MRKFVLFIALFELFGISKQTYAQLQGWPYYRKIMLDNSSGGPLINYQAMLVFDHASMVAAGKSRVDGADIRFTDRMNNSLYYWIEGGINTASCSVWVKIPSITAAGVDTVLFHYGNSMAVTTSNADSTFLFFDDFSGGLGKWDSVPVGWTTNGGRLATASAGIITKMGDFNQCIFETTINKTVDASFNRLYYGVPSNSTDYNSVWLDWASNYVQQIKNNEFQSGVTSFNLAPYTDYRVRFDKQMNGDYAVQINGSLISFMSGWLNFNADRVHLSAESADTSFFDNVRIRRYAPMEPIVTIGNETNQLSDLVLDLRFDGNATDVSGYNNHGTVYGATLTADRFGISNSAYSFDGVNNYIEVSDASSLRSASMTVAAWVMPSDPAFSGTLIGKNNPVTAANEQFYFGLNAGMPRLTIKRNSGCSLGGWEGGDDSTLVPANSWTFITATFDSTNIRIYQNGVLNQTIPTSYGAIDNCPGGSLHIGYWWQNDPQLYKGTLDDIKMYSRALSALEIMTLYNSTINGIAPIAKPQLQAAFYPNPNNGNFHVSISGVQAQVIKIELSDSMGKVYLSKQCNVNNEIVEEQLDAAELSPGVYFLKIASGSQFSVGKVIIR